MYPIDYNSYRSVKGFNQRVRFLVMHYTAGNFSASVKSLSGDGSVSAHYLVPDPTEQTYIDAGFSDMRIFNLVDEKGRAWHAGVSQWADRSNLNDTSIGIEIVNLASEDENGNFNFPAFNDTQIDAVKELALNILQRYPDITPANVVGHSDIAPGRKSDPGAAFPWKTLYEAGIGAWYDDETKAAYVTQFTADGIQQLIRAFQLHFRQENYDGVSDTETAAILYALADKYFPDN